MINKIKKNRQPVFLIFLLTFVYQTVRADFPVVTAFKHSPIVVFDNKKQAVLKKDLVLKSPFAAVTANKDQLEFKLNTFDRVVVYPKSKVQILEFMDEAGFVPELYILDGQIRFRSDFRSAVKDDSVVVLRTPFFDLKTDFIADILIELDMKEPSVEVRVISGVLLLEFFAYEKHVRLKAGNKVKFKGVLSEDGLGIQYDYLLNKRKAPKGALGDVEKFDQSSFIQAEKKIALDEVNKKKMLKQAEEEKKRKQKEYEDSFLCKKPFGQKDQCAWWLENGKCYRKRCNVNAQWGDVIERPVTDKCKSDFVVDVCDY